MRVNIDVKAFLLAFTEWFQCWVVQQRAAEREEEVRQVRLLILTFAPPKGQLFTSESLAADIASITGHLPEPHLLQDALVQLRRSGVIAPDAGSWTVTGQ